MALALLQPGVAPDRAQDFVLQLLQDDEIEPGLAAPVTPGTLAAALAPFRDALREQTPLCGRLNPDKNALLYADRADEVQSSALLSMAGIGLVAVGSRDPNRFFPGMGTLFLRMMGEALAAGLQRFPRG